MSDLEISLLVGPIGITNDLANRVVIIYQTIIYVSTEHLKWRTMPDKNAGINVRY